MDALQQVDRRIEQAVALSCVRRALHEAYPELRTARDPITGRYVSRRAILHARMAEER